MEELKKLEQLQKMMILMESHGIVTNSSSSSSSSSSNRFLANLVLLLLQPCGELDYDMKCELISQKMPKISAQFLDEASQWLGQEDYQVKHVENTLRLCSDITKNGGSFCNNIDQTATIGLDAMQRANSTLEDFCRSYFMFHGMDVNKPHFIFKYLPMLSFAESFIYQLDMTNEKIVLSGLVQLEGGEEEDQSMLAKFRNQMKSNPFRPLSDLLKHHGILADRMIEEFRCGEEYWALERKLCNALISRLEISIEEVIRTIHLKSFDYRVLNLLLYQLRGEKVNDLHMEFLSISEFLVEVADDLFDYEDDVLENNFNILRMFVKMYGAAAPAVLAKYITEAEEKYNSLLKALDPQLSFHYRRRCEEATKEGGKISGYPLGTWSIPTLIMDEESYRHSVNQT